MALSPRLLLLSASLGLSSLLGCGDSSSNESFDLAFYTPPEPLPSNEPGTLIRSEPITPFAEGTRAWRVLYVSRALDGTPIAVSGMVAAPEAPAPAGGRPVVSWGHGTKGVSDPCTPSRGFRSGTHDFFDIAPVLLAEGYVAVSSDYEGLGTPGIHPYLVGDSEGRGKLDMIRAARAMPAIDASDQVVLWGRSQGGHAALFAGEIAPDWAPELDILGVVSAAPGSELPGALSFGAVVPSSYGFLWQITVGLRAAYPELSLDDIYSSEALAAIEGLLDDEACSRAFGETAGEFDGAGFQTNPSEHPAWGPRLEANSPGRRPSGAPILLLQGTEDSTVPKVLTDVLFSSLCASGSQVDYRIFEGFSHNDSTLRNLPLMLEWTAARFAGEAATDTCE